MKKNKYLPLFLVCISALFWRCEERIDLGIDPQDFELHLVVNEFFSAGAPWSIEVASSEFIFGDRPEIIEDATVKIYNEDNEFIYELFHQGNGIYGREDYAPDVNRKYSVSVTHSGFSPVTASSYVPENSSIKINSYTTVVEDKNEGIEVDFQIENVSDVDAYYIWEIVSLEDEEGGSSSSVYGQLSDSFIKGLKDKTGIPKNRKEVIGVGVFGDGTYNTTYNTLDGSRFDGYGADDEASTNDTNPGETGDDFVFGENEEDGEENEDGGESMNDFRYELRVVSISKELFDFYKDKEENATDNPPNSHGDPIERYTNINDGYGIFAGYFESGKKF